MSSSDISDTEIVERRRAEQKRREKALFDEDNDGAAAVSQPRPRPRAKARFLGDADDGVDDLFADLDDVPNVAVPARLDPTALDRLMGSAADASKSSDLGGDIWNDTGADEAVALQKKRKPVAKMDETRLLGPNGFPKLQEAAVKFRARGKGHEKQDLKRLMTLYQLWAHQMYPRTNLRDTLHIVERLCHKRAVQSALKRYRDEARPSIREPSPAASVAGQDNADTNRKKDDGTAHSTAPPAKAQQIDYDDLFADEDDLLAELDLDIGGSALETGSENRREGIMKSGATVSRPAAEGFEEDEDAEEAMRQIDEDV